MDGWRVELVSKAQDDVRALDSHVRQQILDRLQWFAGHFDELRPIPLHGEWKGFYKFRIGDWRVVYNYTSATSSIIVHQVDRRDKVYKKK